MSNRMATTDGYNRLTNIFVAEGITPLGSVDIGNANNPFNTLYINTISTSNILTSNISTSSLACTDLTIYNITPKIQFNNSNNTTNFGYISVDTSDFKINNINSTPMEFYTGGVEKLRINTAGNIGINSTSPTMKLYIASGDYSDAQTWGTGDGVYIGANNSGANSSGLGLGYNSSTNTSYIQSIAPGIAWKNLQLDGLNMIFKTNGTERIRLNTTGNIGISTSSPATKLDVNGGLKATTSTISNMIAGSLKIAIRNTKGNYFIGSSYATGNGLEIFNETVGTTVINFGGQSSSGGSASYFNIYAHSGPGFQSYSNIEYLNIGYDNSTRRYMFRSTASTGNSHYPIQIISNTTSIYLNTIGNVGINTNSPSSTLDVNGLINALNITTTNITTNSLIVSNGSINVSGNISASSQISGSTYTGGSLQLSGSAIIPSATISNLQVSNIVSPLFYTSGNLAVSIGAGILLTSGSLVTNIDNITIKINNNNKLEAKSSDFIKGMGCISAYNELELLELLQIDEADLAAFLDLPIEFLSNATVIRLNSSSSYFDLFTNGALRLKSIGDKYVMFQSNDGLEGMSSFQADIITGAVSIGNLKCDDIISSNLHTTDLTVSNLLHTGSATFGNIDLSNLNIQTSASAPSFFINNSTITNLFLTDLTVGSLKHTNTGTLGNLNILSIDNISEFNLEGNGTASNFFINNSTISNLQVADIVHSSNATLGNLNIFSIDEVSNFNLQGNGTASNFYMTDATIGNLNLDTGTLSNTTPSYSNSIVSRAYVEDAVSLSAGNGISISGRAISVDLKSTPLTGGISITNDPLTNAKLINIDSGFKGSCDDIIVDWGIMNLMPIPNALGVGLTNQCIIYLYYGVSVSLVAITASVTGLGISMGIANGKLDTLQPLTQSMYDQYIVVSNGSFSITSSGNLNVNGNISGTNVSGTYATINNLFINGTLDSPVFSGSTLQLSGNASVSSLLSSSISSGSVYTSFATISNILTSNISTSTSTIGGLLISTGGLNVSGNISASSQISGATFTGGSLQLSNDMTCLNGNITNITLGSLIASNCTSNNLYANFATIGSLYSVFSTTNYTGATLQLSGSATVGSLNTTNLYSVNTTLSNILISCGNTVNKFNIVGGIDTTELIKAHSSIDEYAEINISNLSGYDFALGVNKSTYSDPNAAYIFTYYNTPIEIGTNSIQRMFISTSGNIGIGLSTPSSKLHIYDASGVALNVQCSASQTTITSWSDDKTYIQTSGDVIYAGIGSATLRGLYIGTSGSVGIGTTSPGTNLDVKGTFQVTGTNVGYTKIQPGDSSNGGYLEFHQADTTRKGYIGYGDNNTCFQIQGEGSRNISIGTNAVERMNINSGGNIGINISTAKSLLHLNGSLRVTGYNADNGTATGGYLTMNYNNTVGTFVCYNNTSVSYIPMAFMASSFRFFNGANSEILSVMTGGNIGVNTTNPTSSFHINGSLAKSSGTFDIDHPLVSNKRLIHSFIEGPRVDLIYRNNVKLVSGKATVNIDTDCVIDAECAMTGGTFEKLVDVDTADFYLQNKTGYGRLKGSITGNILNISCEDKNSTDVISWMVIGERKDDHIKEWSHTNAKGKLITEYSEDELLLRPSKAKKEKPIDSSQSATDTPNQT